MSRSSRAHVLGILLCCVGTTVLAQQEPVTESSATSQEVAVDTRTQYPVFLANSYFTLGVGWIGYPFSNRQLTPGFSAGSINIPHLAARVVLFGHEFNRYLSMEAQYMRPGRWVAYRNINGDVQTHTVWTNLAGFTLKPMLPVNRRITLYGAGGVGFASRHGFEIGATPAVPDSVSTNLLLGAGLEYHATPTWDLTADLAYSPGRDSENQPPTTVLSGGFKFNMRPLPEQQVTANRESGYTFPEHVVQVEYTTDAMGYGTNRFFSRKVPIFWGGNVEVAHGAAVRYEQNVFHTRKLFAFDLGAGASYWKSRNDRESFYTLSAYPLFRFTVVRTRSADFYVSYSLAGPTFISREVIDGYDTGRRFTFQDMIGAGIFLGKSRSIIAGVKLGHYSNGNVISDNESVKVPVTFGVGYTF